jgi:hypothetical protein
MTPKGRYVVIASTLGISVALGGGLFAYLIAQRASGGGDGVPAEVSYVPANAALVAYADVRRVMNSELHRELMPTLEGPRVMNDFTGLDFEKQVDHVVAYVEPSNTPDAAADKAPRSMMLLQGTFDQARIEQLIRDRGGLIETHNGHSVFVHREGGEEMSAAFVRPDLLAVGDANLVRRTLGPQGAVLNLTANDELMALIRGASGSTAWMAGYFDAVSRSLKLPPSMSARVPPVRLVLAKADINGGMTAALRAETASNEAAEQLREAVRGFIALARFQAASQPQFESALKSLELSGTDKTVQVSVAFSPETLRALASRAREIGPVPAPVK